MLNYIKSLNKVIKLESITNLFEKAIFVAKESSEFVYL
jgi:hypothetical protein